MRLITNTFEYCTDEVPKWNTISISGYHIREVGSALTAQQPDNNIVRVTIHTLAGYYYVESLTDSIEKEVWDYINKIEDLGGMVKAIEKGYVQKEVQDSAYKYQKDIESNERIVVGVNKFDIKEEAPGDLLKVDPILRNLQIKRLKQVKRNRDNALVTEKLSALRQGAKRSDINLMPLILDAVREYASLGEICKVLRDESGEYRESIVL